ncbi:hypothetical protein OHA37_26795 [Streptomyces sp. NBC_00335]|uniref:hypothetical protein n=1 Tax=unclassified Streptomyces TaxID=2593676 RepID=UPI00225AE393|nr:MULTISPECIES: hypothetical protein [unclassified Streptomyces]MCX5407458.1 hypothetical protein [Streptomyces sp. NBC_00086]
MSLLDIARPHGRHRAVDEVQRLRSQLVPLLILICDLSRRLAVATAGWDAANAKANRLSSIEETAAEATRQLQAQTAELRELRAFKANATAVSSLTAHPAVTETQPIPVLPLHLSPLAGVSPSHVPGF